MLRRLAITTALLAACGSGRRAATGADAGLAAAVADAGLPTGPIQPDVADYPGDPYLDPSLPDATLRVRLTRGEPATPATGVTLHLVSLDVDGVARDVTGVTDGRGEADFKALVADGSVAYHLLGALDGDRLESAPITPPGRGGVRVDLVARAPGSPVPALTGIPDSDDVAEAGQVLINSTDVTAVTLTEVASGRTHPRAPPRPGQEHLARYDTAAAGAVLVARLGDRVSRPLLVMPDQGVARVIVDEPATARCLVQLAREPRSALAGVTRCQVFQPGGAPRRLAAPLRFPMPAGITRASVRDASAQPQLDGDALVWTGPLPPGLRAIDVTFDLPLTGGRATVDLVAASPLVDLAVRIPSGLSIEIEDLEGGAHTRPDYGDNRPDHRIQTGALAAGARLHFVITGATPPTACERFGVSRWTRDGSPAPAPEARARARDGSAVSLAGLRGKPVVVNLMASWSGATPAELPSLLALRDLLGPLGVELVILASDERFEDVDRVLDPAKGITVWLDPPVDDAVLGPASLSFGTRKVPETYLIDAEGLVRAWVVSNHDWTSPDAIACVQSILAPHTGPVSSPPPPPPPPPDAAPPPSRFAAGTLHLGAGLRVPPGARLFLVARDPASRRIVVGQMLQPDHFPMPFALTSADVMTGDPVPAALELEARIDQDGDATTRTPGDLSGTATTTLGATDVTLTLDQQVR